jgi:hypothetical protein
MQLRRHVGNSLVTLLITGSLVLAAAAPAAATTLIGDWKLKGGFKNVAGTNLKMSRVGDVTFESVNVLGKTRKTLRFDEGEGVRVARIPQNARRSYSISVLFEFDSVEGYRRIHSFGPNDRDDGLYVQSGRLDLYPNWETDAEVTAADEWHRVHITRSGKNGRMNVYLDGVKVLTYLDSAGDYLLRKGTVVFFQDNLVDTGTEEHPSGTAASIKIWRGAKAP